MRDETSVPGFKPGMKSDVMHFWALKQRCVAVLSVPVSECKVLCAMTPSIDNDTCLLALIGKAGANPM